MPAFLALVAEPLFLLIDSAIVGHLGTSELAGLGVASAVLLTAANLFVFLAYGTTSIVARQVGAGHERAALASVGLDFELVPPRYRSTYFRHTFEGGYDAAYYSYIWSEVLDADTAAFIRANGGLSRENGDRFRRHLLARGGSIDPTDSYRDYRGADPDLRHLLERRGLV